MRLQIWFLEQRFCFQGLSNWEDEVFLPREKNPKSLGRINYIYREDFGYFIIFKGKLVILIPRRGGWPDWPAKLPFLSPLSLSLNFANKRNPPKFSFSLSLYAISLSILLIKRNPPKFSLSHLLKISYFSLSPTLFTFLE